MWCTYHLCSHPPAATGGTGAWPTGGKSMKPHFTTPVPCIHAWAGNAWLAADKQCLQTGAVNPQEDPALTHLNLHLWTRRCYLEDNDFWSVHWTPSSSLVQEGIPPGWILNLTLRDTIGDRDRQVNTMCSFNEGQRLRPLGQVDVEEDEDDPHGKINSTVVYTKFDTNNGRRLPT